MKILSIKGKNLASLAGEFEIDFTREPLASAGLFAITGHTGSGKSTILDALCLALFDDTPRLHNAKEQGIEIADVRDKMLKQDDCRAILRRGTAEGYAQVRFVSLQGGIYEAKWFVQRTQGKPDGSLKDSVITLYDITGKQEFKGRKKEVLEKIVSLTGLTFDQFTRAVLLAQGDFTVFMKAKVKEKAELLEKLTGTEIYSQISMLIYVKAAQAKQDLQFVQDKVRDIALLSQEDIERLKVDKTAIESSESGIRRDIDILTAKIKWIKDYNMYSRDLKDAMKSMETAERDIESARPRYEYLQLWDKAQSVRDIYLKLRKNKKEWLDNKEYVRQQKEQVENLNAKFKTETAAIEMLGDELRKVEQAWDKLQPEINTAQSLDVKIEEAGKRLLELKGELSKAQQRKDSAEKSIAASAKQLSQLQGEDLTSELERLTAEQTRLSGLLTTEIKTLRERLQTGEPCPVCGSPEHPYHGRITEDIEEKKLNEARLQIETKINAAKEKIDRTKTGINTLQGRIESEKSSLATFTDDYAAKNTAYTAAAEQLTALQAERGLLLKGATVDDLKKRYNAKRTELAGKSEKALKAKDETARRAGELSGSIATKMRDNDALEKEITNLEAQQSEWLSSQNAGVYTDDKLSDIFGKSIQWVENERKILQQLQDKLTTSKATLQERQKNLDKHSQEEIKPENETETDSALAEIKNNKEISLEVLGKRRMEVEVRLRHDAENRLLCEKYEKDIAVKSVLFENWSKLNVMLGSADGAKFKKIAQEYTLDYLLDYANKHLQQLTGRYELQRIPESLALQVVDLDMGNEVRTVHSLSGGESFLVSLALALGLSSLSSNRMNIESLFIDEGFGSLDSDTLRVAMDTLEHLHSIGRKIGVISHVAEMTERIKVRINVHKTAGGKSKITITG